MKKEKMSFDEFYREKIGDERWPTLKDALLFEREKFPRKVFNEKNKEFCKSTIYYMDKASVIVADALPLVTDKRTAVPFCVLDLCSAPGGKSLILWERLAEKNISFELTLNEMSGQRKERLRSVLNEYLTKDQQRSIRLLGLDGRSLGMQSPSYYDAILVDAPCSSESHVLKDQKELESWSPKRPKVLAATQYALLCSAYLALKPSGFLLYSTCSINPDEDDGVIEKVISKKNLFVCKPEIQSYPYEETKFGVAIFPDRFSMGPIYFSLLQKGEDK